MDIEARKVALPDRKSQDILSIFYQLDTQYHIVWKYLENLIGKLHSMQLIVAHLYHIQLYLTQGGEYRIWLFP